ncbi:hypothetical protein [Limnospira fusiformis]|uniref:hypothetical protein n=1 Tax=Limnospira fusiformis TaxID=54297 RepID=UPI00348ACAB7
MTTALGEWLMGQDSQKRLDLLRHQPSDFAEAGEVEALRAWLTDFGFLQQKLEAVGITALMSDYNLALPLLSGEERQTLRLIQEALRLSADALVYDSSQLAGQLLGRLLWFSQPQIVALLEQAKQWREKIWFRPLTANLTPPGNSLIRTLTGHSSDINAVAIAPDGKRAISGAEDKTLKWWDLATGLELATLRGHSGAVKAVAIAPDSETAVSGSEDTTLKLWDLVRGWEWFDYPHQALATFEGHSGEVNAVAITPDGKRAISASEDTTLQWWDLEMAQEFEDPQEPLAIFTGHNSNWVNAVAIAPDGKTAISAADDQTLKVWDLEMLEESSEDSQEPLATFEGHSDEINAVAIAPDGKTAVSASSDNTLKVWDLATGLELATLRGHNYQINAVAITPDSKKAVSGSADRTLKVWDLATGLELTTFYGHTHWVNAVAIAPDGKTAVSASSDHTLKVWDLVTEAECCNYPHERLATHPGHNSRVNAVAIAPDGKKAVSVSYDHTVKVWDLATGLELASFKNNSKKAKALAVYAFSKHTRKLEKVPARLKLATRRAHNYDVNVVAIAPDGKTAVSASSDRTLKLWDLATGGVLATFTGEAPMISCAVADDGVTVVAGDWLGGVNFLRLEGLRD